MRNMRYMRTRIHIKFSSVLFIVLLFICDSSVYTVITLLAACLHEIGHIVAIKLCGAQILEITVYPFGADIKTDGRYLSYGKEAIVYLSGAVANILGAVISYFFSEHLPYASFFCLCNIVLIILNLMPVQSLDGGRALECFLCITVGYVKGAKILRGASFISIVILWIWAVWALIYTSYNFSLFLMCVYLFASIFLTREKSKI